MRRTANGSIITFDARRAIAHSTTSMICNTGDRRCSSGWCAPHRRATNTEVAMTYYHEHQSDFLEGLKTFLRIPSISTLSEHKPDIRRAAEFAVNELRTAGMSVAETIEGEGNPLVYAE